MTTSSDPDPQTRAPPSDSAAEDPRAATDLAPVGLGVATLDGVVVSANEELARLLGFDRGAELVGASLAPFHPAPELAADVLRSRLADGIATGIELDILRRDGTELVVRGNARLHEAAEGGLRVHFAVTEARSAARRPEASSRSQKMEAVERFAAGVAHDYNNLLTTIIGETTQLLADLPPSSASHESASSILRDAKRAAEITQRLLVFSRAEEGRPERVDLNRTIAELGAELGAELEGGLADDVALQLRLEEELPAITIDPGHLRVVLANLVRNANDAMPDGGRIVIESSIVRAPDDTNGLDFHPPVPAGKYVSIAVGDTGSGMDARTRRRVFDPFFTTKEPGDGSGLGLTTVYGLVLRASGHLAVISAPAWGTVVRVLLPVRARSARTAPRGAAAPLAGSRPEPSAPGSQKRILVVDDESSVLRVISRILRRAGYIVHKAEDGYSAQDEIRRRGHDLDLVISDVMMPQMRGTELVRWLQDRSPATPVLLVSGYADSELVREWVEGDPNSFLPKPFEPEELLERVRLRLGETALAP